MNSLNCSRSASDKKNYALRTLSCGLEVLLISSKQLNDHGRLVCKAAAALCVGVGSFADPIEAEGLAHFLEHIVFMGSEKYPGENEYESFLSSHGGDCNACTEGEYTCYTFDVLNEYFPQALDMFAQCIIAPRLVLDSCDRELKAIDNEFNIAKNSESSRLFQLMSHTCRKGHILNKFGWGNMESLKNKPKSNSIDMESLIRQFYSAFYVPSNCKLTVIASKSLEEIETDVNNSFGGWVANQDTSTPSRLNSFSLLTFQNMLSTREPPFDLKMKPPLVRRIAALKNTHRLILCWQLPPSLHLYRKKTTEYLSHLMGHEGENSLFSLLKKSGLVTSLCAGVRHY